MRIRHVKRPRYLFFAVEESDFVDLAALLAGEVAVSSQPQLVALSLLSGSKFAVSQDDVLALTKIGGGSWNAAEQLDLPSNLLEDMARKGLLLTDSDDPELAGLRERHDLLERQQWHPYAALYHFMTRSIEDSAGASFTDTESLASTASEDAAEFARRHGAPPESFYRAPGSQETVELPRIEKRGGVFEVLQRRKTIRAFDMDRPMTFEDFATLLRYVYGVHGRARLSPDVDLVHKTSPSGGSLHPIEVYPLVLGVRGLEAGAYHYETGSHSLRRLQRLEESEARKLAVEIGNGQSHAGTAACVFVMAARFFRCYWKYRRRSKAYSVVLMDTAHLSQTLQLVATALDLGAFFSAALNSTAAEKVLGLDSGEQGAIAICGCGVRRAGAHHLGLEFEDHVPGGASRR